MLTVILLLISAISRSAGPAQKPIDSWLHPGDSAYRAAIQDGFTGKAKIGPYNEGKGGIHQLFFTFTSSRAKDNKMIFFSPLRCAQLVGLDARQNLSDSPTVEFARKTCDGNLFVTITYSSRYEASSFPLALEHEGVTARPPSVEFTSDPRIDTHWNGFSMDTTYTYNAVFYFSLPEQWTSDATLRFVIPEVGDPLDLKIDFSTFVKDEAAYERI
ncbi:MAG: hypothetical protein ABSB65_12175 [Candidatus Acidiferrales bacterium]|jgi:hypothetical protein